MRFVEIAYGSPHGSELLDENNRLCGDLAARIGRALPGTRHRVLRRAARAGEIDLEARRAERPEAAELFVHGVSGLKGPGVTVERYRRRLAGARPGVRRGARRGAVVTTAGAPSGHRDAVEHPPHHLVGVDLLGLRLVA